MTYRFIAVCKYHNVITLDLRSKYDMGGHYSRFTAQILAHPLQHDIMLLCILQLYCMQTFNYSFGQVAGNPEYETIGHTFTSVIS